MLYPPRNKPQRVDWNVENFIQNSILTLPQQTYGLTFLANLKRLAGRDYTYTILVWDAKTKEQLSVVADTWEHNYWPVMFSQDSGIWRESLK